MPPFAGNETELLGICATNDFFCCYRMWQKGFCIGATGNSCKLRHYYNEMDGALMQVFIPHNCSIIDITCISQAARRQAQRPVNETNQLEDYSSPYRVKVVKEVSKQRKEEVDLETGKRKSWVETTEFEVLDLTGGTPVKKSKLLLSQSKSPPPLKESNNTDTASKGNNKKTPVTTSAPAQVVDSGTCPKCARKFKGEKGVAAHRRARNSACHPDKENNASNQVPSDQVRSLVRAQENPSRNPAVIAAQNLPSSNSVQNTTPASANRGFFSGFLGISARHQQDQDDSIIVIPDTPVPGNRRVSLRRSIRLA